ncbi:hypothetical protein D4100_08515 [Serratia inhibens]|uniref:Uncharacterized protein n=1 Tax=Serratia inhibens TaxID=2338073 RepID=A0AA93BXY9_9GAMM|nr:hypothetical protein [Serratia inhibens]RJF58769.1 hypothetical protein D4100_08515 [Serratia inhibens]
MTTKQDNEFILTYSEIKNIEYRTNSAYVSSGQPFDVPPTITEQSSGSWKINFAAGRHKTSAVSKSFMAVTGGSSLTVIASDSWDKTPEELNFYFGLDISFKTSGFDNLLIYLAQGSSGAHNNWWLGSANLVNSNGTALLVGTQANKIAWKALLNMSNSSCSLSSQ